jgi:hypothetical protein
MMTSSCVLPSSLPRLDQGLAGRDAQLARRTRLEGHVIELAGETRTERVDEIRRAGDAHRHGRVAHQQDVQGVGEVGDRPAPQLRGEKGLEQVRGGLCQPCLDPGQTSRQLRRELVRLLPCPGLACRCQLALVRGLLLGELLGKFRLGRRLAFGQAFLKCRVARGGPALGSSVGPPPAGPLVGDLELGQVAGDGGSGHALSAPRIHCFRMAAAWSSS